MIILLDIDKNIQRVASIVSVLAMFFWLFAVVVNVMQWRRGYRAIEFRREMSDMINYAAYRQCARMLKDSSPMPIIRKEYRKINKMSDEKIPSYWRLILSFKPFKMEAWFDEQTIEKIKS